MAIERMITGQGDAILQLQNFLNTTSRDIVDESDENFSVKFELVHTMGAQRPIDYSLIRWIVEKFMPTVKGVFPNSVELHPGPSGCFRRAKASAEGCGRYSRHKVAEYVCENGLTGLPIAQQTGWICKAVYQYIREPHLTREEFDLVECNSRTRSPRRTNLVNHILQQALEGGLRPRPHAAAPYEASSTLPSKRCAKQSVRVQPP